MSWISYRPGLGKVRFQHAYVPRVLFLIQHTVSLTCLILRKKRSNLWTYSDDIDTSIGVTPMECIFSILVGRNCLKLSTITSMSEPSWQIPFQASSKGTRTMSTDCVLVSLLLSWKNCPKDLVSAAANIKGVLMPKLGVEIPVQSQ